MGAGVRRALMKLSVRNTLRRPLSPPQAIQSFSCGGAGGAAQRAELRGGEETLVRRCR